MRPCDAAAEGTGAEEAAQAADAWWTLTARSSVARRLMTPTGRKCWVGASVQVAGRGEWAPCVATTPGLQRRLRLALRICQHGLLHCGIADSRWGRRRRCCRRRRRSARRRRPWHCSGRQRGRMFCRGIARTHRYMSCDIHRKQTLTAGSSHHPGRQHGASASARHLAESIERPEQG